jgi:hypothetical protein
MSPAAMITGSAAASAEKAAISPSATVTVLTTMASRA